MIRKLRTAAIMFSQIGDTRRVGKQIDAIFRYYVLKTLADEGLFKYLEKPLTYGQILSEFGWVDSAYARSVFHILTTEANPPLIVRDNLYQLNPDKPLPSIDKLVDSTSPRLHNFSLMAQGICKAIPSRLRDEPFELVDTFEADARQLLTKFDRHLGMRVYQTARRALFNFLTREERQALRGSQLLEIGCGSGRETAELWLHLNGDVRITATDAVPGLVELARQNFGVYLDELSPKHAPCTEANAPEFKVVSATQIPYPDNTFDATFAAFVLHWTPDARESVREIVRVTKPGGLIFGLQPTLDMIDFYFDLAIRSNRNVNGAFWREEFIRWFGQHGIELETFLPLCLFRGHKPARASKTGADATAGIVTRG